MKLDESSLELLSIVRKLSDLRRYQEVENRLVAVQTEYLFEDPEVGYHLAVARLHLRKAQEGLKLVSKMLENVGLGGNLLLRKRLELLYSIFLGRVGRLEEAEEVGLACLPNGSGEEPLSFAASAYNSLGVIYCLRGDWPVALPEIQRALTMYQVVGDRYGIAAAFHNLGTANRYVGRYEDAEQYFISAAVFFQSEGILEEAVFTEAERSLAVLGLGDILRAERMAARALNRCRTTHNPELLGETLRVAGMIARSSGRREQSRSAFLEAFECAGGNANPQLQAELHLEMGKLEIDCGNQSQAAEHIQSARAYYKSIGATGFERLATGYLSSLV